MTGDIEGRSALEMAPVDEEVGPTLRRLGLEPADVSRLWVVFDRDTEGFETFLADPDVPAIFQGRRASWYA